MSSNWLVQVPSQVFAYVLQVPFLATLIVSVASIRKDRYDRWGKEFILLLFGICLLLWWVILLILQIAMNMPREDPFHAGEVYYGFPSGVGFYTTALIFFFIEYSYLWNVHLSRTYWIIFYACLALPAVTLCWFQFNSWQEVLLSMGLGIFATTTFILFYYYCVLPNAPELIVSVPFNWMGAVDTLTLSIKEQQVVERMRAIPREARD